MLSNDTDVDAGDTQSIGVSTSTAAGATSGNTTGVTIDVNSVGPTGIPSATIGVIAPNSLAYTASSLTGFGPGGGDTIIEASNYIFTVLGDKNSIVNDSGGNPVQVVAEVLAEGATITFTAEPATPFVSGQTYYFDNGVNFNGNSQTSATLNTTTVPANNGIEVGDSIFLGSAAGTPLVGADGITPVTVTNYDAGTGEVTFSEPVTNLSGTPTLFFNNATNTSENSATVSATAAPVVLNNSIQNGDLVFINGTDPLLDINGVQVTVQSYNSTTGELVFTVATDVDLSGNPPLRFATDSGGTSENTATPTAATTTTTSNTINVSSIDGAISVGMTVTGTLEGGGTFSREVLTYDAANNTITVDGAPLDVSDASPNLTFTQALSNTVTLTGQYGTLELDTGTGDYTYTAYSGLTGGDKVDTFNYTMNDALNAQSTATLTINVSVQTTPPTANPDAVSVTESGDILIGAGNNVITGAGTGSNAADVESDGAGTATLTVTDISFAGTAGTVGTPLAGASGLSLIHI